MTRPPFGATPSAFANVDNEEDKFKVLILAKTHVI